MELSPRPNRFESTSSGEGGEMPQSDRPAPRRVQVPIQRMPEFGAGTSAPRPVERAPQPQPAPEHVSFVPRVPIEHVVAAVQHAERTRDALAALNKTETETDTDEQEDSEQTTRYAPTHPSAPTAEQPAPVHVEAQPPSVDQALLAELRTQFANIEAEQRMDVATEIVATPQPEHVPPVAPTAEYMPSPAPAAAERAPDTRDPYAREVLFLPYDAAAENPADVLSAVVPAMYGPEAAATAQSYESFEEPNGAAPNNAQHIPRAESQAAFMPNATEAGTDFVPNATEAYSGFTPNATESFGPYPAAPEGVLQPESWDPASVYSPAETTPDTLANAAAGAGMPPRGLGNPDNRGGTPDFIPGPADPNVAPHAYGDQEPVQLPRAERPKPTPRSRFEGMFVTNSRFNTAVVTGLGLLGLEHFSAKKRDKKLEKQLVATQRDATKQQTTMAAEQRRQSDELYAIRHAQERTVAQSQSGFERPVTSVASSAERVPTPAGARAAERPINPMTPAELAAADQADAEAREQGITLEKGQELHHSVWHTAVTEDGRVVEGAINYGAGFKGEQRELRHDPMADDKPQAAVPGGVGGAFPGLPGAVNPSLRSPLASSANPLVRSLSDGSLLPATNPELALPPGQPRPDFEHRLPAPARQTVASNIGAPWFWIMLAIVVAAFFTALAVSS